MLQSLKRRLLIKEVHDIVSTAQDLLKMRQNEGVRHLSNEIHETL